MSTTTSPRLADSSSRRHFWITVVCLLLANVAAWAVYDRAFARLHRGTLRVDRFEPGNNAVVGPRAPVRWRFSADVIPTSRYGREPGRVTPKVPGNWTWDDPRTLVFTPENDLPRATHVSFSLDSAFLRSDTGATLPQPYVSGVNASPLELTEVRQTGAADNDRYVIELHFSDRVAPGDVLQHLKLTTADGHAVRCQLHGEAAGKIVRVITDAIPAARSHDEATLSLRVTPGLIGLAGPLGIAGDQQTTISLGRSTFAIDLKGWAPARGQAYLLLNFNNDVDVLAVKEILSIDPPTPFTVESRGNGIRLLGDFHPGTRYTAKLAAAPQGADRAKYPRPAQLATFVADRGAGLWFESEQGYLSSAGNRTLVVHTVNIDVVQVSITRMYDNNLVAWRNAVDRERWSGTDDYSRPLAERTIKLPVRKNAQQDVRLSLDELLPTDAPRDGVYRVAVNPSSKDIDPSDSSDGDDESYEYRRYNNGAASAVVTLSDIGLTAKQTRDGLVAWTTSLRTAAPLANVRVRLFSNKNQTLGEAISNADGIATISGVHPAKDETPALALADTLPAITGDSIGPQLAPTTRPVSTQLTWLDLRGARWDLGDGDINGRPYLRSGHEAFVYTDRGVYRPGEIVHLRAIVRGPDNAPPRTTFPVRWQLRRPDQRDWKNFTVMLSADGSAALDVQMPADLPTGQWTTSIGLSDEYGSAAKGFGSANFFIEEFIPNRLKNNLSFSNATADRFAVTEGELKASVQADYLFGRPAAGQPLELTTRTEAVAFHPEGWVGWTFGDSANVVIPAARAASLSKRGKRTGEPPREAMLDSAGHFNWSIAAADLVGQLDLADLNVYRGPWKLTASAAVREAGGRAVTATKQIQLDALAFYIGVKRDSLGAVAPGGPIDLQLTLVKPSGAPAGEQDAAIEARLLRASWNTVLNYRTGRYRYESTRVLDEVEKTTIHVDGGHGAWQPKVPSHGSYILAFRDPRTGAATSIAFDASDGSPWDDNVSRENPEHVEVRLLASSPSTSAGTQALGSESSAPRARPDAFHVGDTANVLVASPFAGRLLLSVETDIVVQTTVIDMTASHVVVPVKITSACRPNAFVSATVIRPIDPNAKWKAHRAFGVTRLNVDASDRRLNIAITAPAELRPQNSMDIGLAVTDSAGQPVRGAAVTVAAVDEGICTLTNFATPDPLGFFSAKRALSVDSADVFGLLMPEVARPDKTSAVGGDGDALTARHHTPIVARRVRSIALAWSEVHTDENGLARANFSVPEFQGRLRVMAVGHANSNFGTAERGVMIRSPVVAQTTWPRFAAPGDRFTVPIVLFNNTSAAGEVKIAVQAADTDASAAAMLTFANIPSVKLAAAGQRQIDLPVVVSQTAGVAKIRLTAAMNGETFEENLELPIRPAAPTMQFGGYLVASTTQPAVIDRVPALLSGSESLRIGVTPWPTLQLPAGLDYLDRYPHGCVEQTTSICFPLIALSDIGRQLDPDRFNPERIRFKIESGTTHLLGMQTSDGGLAMWAGGRTAWPWASVYAAHFLTEARLSGYEVPDDFYRHLLSYVRHLLDAGTDDAVQLETQAYAAYVLALSGRIERAILNRLTELATVTARPDDPADGHAIRSDARLMLSCAWLLAGRRDLAEGLIPQTLPAPRTHRQAEGNIGSPVRDRALLIQTLLAVQPDHPALPDLVQRLADAGAKRGWANTQDTAQAVLAIGKYLRETKKREPYDSAQLWLAEKVLASSASGGSLSWEAPSSAGLLPTTAPSQAYSVKIEGKPEATAHVTWLKTGVPLQPPADAEHGMKIHRRYFTLDGNEVRNVVRSGDLVRVELTIEGPPRLAGIVIEDLLPAGLEAENARLETATKDRSKDQRAENDVPSFSDGRVDVRDDRVLLVGSMPDAWKARSTYLARAVTPGVYILPPVRAEQMYDINVNALSGAGGTLTVTNAAAGVASLNEVQKLD